MNVFHGRLHEDKAYVGELELDCPEFLSRELGTRPRYVRPHGWTSRLLRMAQADCRPASCM